MRVAMYKICRTELRPPADHPAAPQHAAVTVERRNADQRGNLPPVELAIRGFAAATTPARIAVAVIVLFSTGLLMGTAFQLGMRLAAAGAPGLTPRLWGVNGATSVCASVLAVVIALNAGISTSFWTGVACVLAALAFRAAHRRPAPAPSGG